jgi:hypothetical protein
MQSSGIKYKNGDADSRKSGGMRNKQDITDYKKLWIALLRSSQLLAMTDNRLILRLLHCTRLPVIARNEAIQKENNLLSGKNPVRDDMLVEINLLSEKNPVRDDMLVATLNIYGMRNKQDITD